MKLKVYILPLILLTLQLRLDLIQEKTFRKPVRDIFYIASQTRRKIGPRISIPTAPVERADVIEYYGNTKGQKGVVAVISLNGEVYTIREGEFFGKRYKVLSIYPDRVILKDTKSNKEIIIKLKEG